MLSKKGLVLYEFMIFNKNGQLVYFEDLEKMETAKIEERVESDREFRHKIQNTFGICAVIQEVAKTIGQKITTGPDSNSAAFNDFVTSQYKLSFFKAPTGMSFVLLTSKDSSRLSPLLAEIYAKVYVEQVTKNPLSDSREGSIKCPNFSKGIKSFFKSRFS